MDLFYADPHFGHKGIIVKCRPRFLTVEQMNRFLIEEWNAVVNNGDTVHVLGDVFLNMKEAEAYAIREKLKGNICLVTGNHDKLAKKMTRAWAWIKEIYYYRSRGEEKTEIYLHHFPHRTWPKSHYDSWHLHGHTHGELRPDPSLLSFDVGVDCTNFRPVSLDQVRERMKHLIILRDAYRNHAEAMANIRNLALKMPAGTYRPAGWRDDRLGNEVILGTQRICSEMTEEAADYFSSLDPATVLRLLDYSFGLHKSIPRKTTTEVQGEMPHVNA